MLVTVPVAAEVYNRRIRKTTIRVIARRRAVYKYRVKLLLSFVIAAFYYWSLLSAITVPSTSFLLIERRMSILYVLFYTCIEFLAHRRPLSSSQLRALM
jgi:hypothetical protein